MLTAALAAAALAWTPLPDAPLSQAEVGAARVGGSIYVVGGFVDGARTTAAVRRYVIARRRWRRVRRCRSRSTIRWQWHTGAACT